MRPGVGIGAVLGAVLLLAPAVPGADREAIQRAINRGVAHLKDSQGKDGTGALVLTTARGRQAARACACYALALVFRAQMGPGTDLGKYAGYYMRRAQAEASTLVAFAADSAKMARSYSEDEPMGG